MKQKQFRRLTELEKKAKLAGVILQKTEGKFSIEQIRNIVNQIDINLQYKIIIYNDSKQFAKKITLINSSFSHSWAGSEGLKQKGFILFGNLEFGINIHKEYSNNGNTETPDEEKIDPDFDINDLLVVFIESNDWNNLEGNCNHHDDYEYELCFYIPENEPYKIDNDIMELIKTFNLE